MAIAKKYVIFANGVFLSNALKSITKSAQNDMLDKTTLDSTVREMTPALSGVTISAEGLWSKDEQSGNAIDNVLTAALSANDDGNLVWATANAIGALAYFCRFVETSYGAPVTVSELLMARAEFQANNLYRGVVAFTDQTLAPGAAVNSAAINHGAETYYGFAWQAHAETTGSAQTLVTLQHSADGSTWTDLDTATITGRGSVQKSIAPGATVRQYTRIIFAPSGGGIRAFAATSRKPFGE